jgi:anti-anti-sigma regulatory factor
MAVELVKDAGAWTLKLSGACDVFDVATLHEVARAAAEAPGAVAVSLHGVQALDTAAAQVLLALRQALARRDLEARFDGMPEALAERWRQLGLDITRG